jgi:hypothetical protein
MPESGTSGSVRDRVGKPPGLLDLDYCREAIPLYLLAGHPRLLWWCLGGYASVSWQQRLQIGRSPPWLASMRRNAWKRSPNQMSRKGVS